MISIGGAGFRRVAQVALSGALIFVPALAITILSILLLDAIARAAHEPFGDWLTYYRSVQRVLLGGPLYEPKQLVGPYHMPDSVANGYPYAPASIAALLPFGLGMPGLAAWLAVTFGLFLSGLWAALRRDLDRAALPAFSVALVIFVIFLPFSSAVVTANVNVAIAGTYAWCWAVGRSEGRIGVLVGIVSAFKIFPGVLAFWPTGSSRRMSMALAIVAVAVLTVLSLPLTGVQTWPEFLAVVANAQPTCSDGRISLACLLLPEIGAAWAKSVAMFVGVAVFIAALWTKRERVAFVLFGAAMMVPVIDLHPHTWLIAYVALAVGVSGLLKAWREGRNPRPGAVAP